MRRSVLALAWLVACGSSDRDRGTGTRTPNNCGNDEVDNGEVCDGANFGSATCTSLGLGAGVLSCATNCKSLNKSMCGAAASCGNGMLDAAELCDATSLGTATCSSVGLGSGTLACLANCNGYDTTGCVPANNPVCGNGNVEGVEVCDGANFGGATCNSLGFTGGALACAPDCRSRITTGCTGSCTPQCGARVCGPDPSCGTSCGTCSSGTCSASGLCEGSPPTGAPVIINFTTNVTTFRSGDLIFSAIVTDPDGVDDLIGGQLAAPGGGTYGSFATAAQAGAYSLTLTRQSLQQVDSLNGPNTGVSRTFRATFFDAAGHNVSMDLTINVRCPADSESLCDGSCYDLSNNEEHCGQCARSCIAELPPGAERDYDDNELALPWCQMGQCVFGAFAKGGIGPISSCLSVCTDNGASTCAAPAFTPPRVGFGFYETCGRFPISTCAAAIPSSMPNCPLNGVSCRCQL